jgi:hypothetical protein
LANTFGVNLEPAEALAGDLARVGADLADTSWATGDARQVTGSPKVAAALDGFFANSSDSRNHMRELLERASGLVNMLVDGVRVLDQGLGDAVDAGGGR